MDFVVCLYFTISCFLTSYNLNPPCNKSDPLSVDPMMKKIFLPLLLVISAVLPLAAQEAPLELSWADCVREALANNPALKAKKLVIDQYKYRYLSSYNAYFPVKVSHSIDLSRSGGSGVSPASKWDLGFSISAAEPLFDLKTISSVKSSKISYEKAAADYRNASANLRQSLYSAFVSLLVAQEKVRVQTKIMAIRKESAELIKLKYDSGMESRGNMMVASALADQNKSDAQQAERSLNMARRELLGYMGSSDYRPLTAKAELQSPEYDLKAESVRAALENIPQVISSEKSVETAKQSLFSAKYDIFPTLYANQSLGWSGPSEFPSKRGWAIGLSLNLPLLSGGITSYSNNTAAAKSALKSAEESLRGLKVSLENNIINAYDDFLNARDSAAVNVNVLKANEESYKESQIQYMAGKISFIDLEGVEKRMVDSQLAQLINLLNANTRKIALENLLGVGLEN